MKIFSQVLDFIEHPRPEQFEELALAVFAYQFDSVEPYRAYCLDLGASPATVNSLDDIPPVSTAAFKYATLSSQIPERIFLTSGTSRGHNRRGRHFVAHLDVYCASAVAHLRRMMFPDGKRLRMLALHPTAEIMPESSLSQMLSWAIENFGNGQSLCCATPRAVDAAAGAAFLARAEKEGEAACILGTTAAFSSLFDYLRDRGDRIRLPAGSRLMDTGGAKGQTTPLQAAELLFLADSLLGIAPEFAINEYGMTELCSQLYDATALNCATALPAGVRAKIAPPWLSVIARDPVTMRPTQAGQPGLLCFFDLANAGSVSALMTEDLGVVGADGLVTIYGRALAADPRGCALGIEQFAESGNTQPARARPGSPADTQPLAATDPDQLATIARRLSSLAPAAAIGQRVARALADACRLWRQPHYLPRRATIAAIGAASGQSEALLQASLDALLSNFTADQMMPMARTLACRDRLIGFIMPGNVVGAGLHELIQALIAGACAIVKPASAEPLFFAEFARTLADIDSEAGQRLAVVNFSRGQHDNALAMAQLCDRVVVFGDDDTVATLDALLGHKLIGFGARLSAGFVAREASAEEGLAAAVARDVTLYEQRGCLSLHHLFVEAAPEQARSLAQQVAIQLDELARRMPPAPPPPSDAASARAVREDARWRAMNGDVIHWNGGKELTWSVIFDPAGELQPSPLCRTLRIGAIGKMGELEARLSPAAGRIEGMAIADPAGRTAPLHSMLRRMGVSHFCLPGELQSPPPCWEHGDGRFVRLLSARHG